MVKRPLVQSIFPCVNSRFFSFKHCFFLKIVLALSTIDILKLNDLRYSTWGNDVGVQVGLGCVAHSVPQIMGCHKTRDR